MKLYHFMQDSKWYEDVAHILVGLVPFWGWVREHRQWPPGKPRVRFVDAASSPPVEYFDTQLDRVADSYRDFLGYAIGDLLRTAVLIGLLVWRW